MRKRAISFCPKAESSELSDCGKLERLSYRTISSLSSKTNFSSFILWNCGRFLRRKLYRSGRAQESEYQVYFGSSLVSVATNVSGPMKLLRCLRLQHFFFSQIEISYNLSPPFTGSQKTKRVLSQIPDLKDSFKTTSPNLSLLPGNSLCVRISQLVVYSMKLNH